MRNRKIRESRRTEQIPIRFSAAERETVCRVAEQEHDYPSSYLRKLCLKYIEQREVTIAKQSQPATI